MIRRRPVDESLDYLADVLVEVCPELPDGPAAKVGGVAIALHTLAEEMRGGDGGR